MWITFSHPNPLEKLRSGVRSIRRYSPPATPCDRGIQDPNIPAWTKKGIIEYRAALDPVALLHSIRQAQSAMATMFSPQPLETPHVKNIDRFLARLPSVWQKAEDQFTHKARVRPLRHWRTRKDPLEGAWGDVLLYLERDPDTTAKDLMPRLSDAHTERFSDAQLRTLRSRVKEWRGLMAKELGYATSVVLHGKLKDLVRYGG